MGENGATKPELSPKEDGSKVPLTDGTPPTVDDNKTNGDAKIDMGNKKTAGGLTKEELMKYADDPFWVRLRWILFVAFWLIWVLMLVFAVIIIIRAPKCQPPPELFWVQESALVQVDRNAIPTEKDLIKVCKDQSATSVYFPDLISETDFEDANYDVSELIKALAKEELRVVTDMPGRMLSQNPLYDNFTQSGMLESNGLMNYTNANLSQAMYDAVGKPWNGKGVKGFLIKDESSLDVDRYVKKLNDLLKEEGGSIANDIKGEESFIDNPFTASAFRDFLEGDSSEWSFYKFNPHYAANSSLSKDELRLVTIALYLSYGTPVLSYGMGDNSTYDLLQGLADFREQDGLKFGITYFSNMTTEDVVAYTRVYKGTPAYAIALNFGSKNETVSFVNTTNIAESGTMELRSSSEMALFDTRTKIGLDSVMLGPSEGVVLQFVASFG